MSSRSVWGAGSADEDYCRTLLGWDELSRELHDEPIVNFNPLGVAGATCFNHDLEVLAALQGLQPRFPPRSLQACRLRGHEAFLRQSLGQPIPFNEYIRATQMVPTKPFSAAYLRRRRELAERSLAAVGLRYGAGIASESEEMVGPEEMPAMWRALTAQELPRLEAAIGRELRFEFDIEHVEVDDYWLYWMDTHEGRFRIRMNVHERPLARAEVIHGGVLHEIVGHLAQAHAWCQEVQAGRLAPSLTLQTQHTLEGFCTEGVAQTLSLWLAGADDVDPILLAWLRMEHYWNLVFHNAHVLVNQGAPIEQCAEYVSINIPDVGPPCGALADLRRRSTDPMRRSYLLSYGIGQDAMVRAAERLEPVARRQLLVEMYTRPMTYAGFQRRVAALAHHPSVETGLAQTKTSAAPASAA